MPARHERAGRVYIGTTQASSVTASYPQPPIDRGQEHRSAAGLAGRREAPVDRLGPLPDRSEAAERDWHTRSDPHWWRDLPLAFAPSRPPYARLPGARSDHHGAGVEAREDYELGQLAPDVSL